VQEDHEDYEFQKAGRLELEVRKLKKAKEFTMLMRTRTKINASWHRDQEYLDQNLTTDF
jgi:hypothetical protein